MERFKPEEGQEYHFFDSFGARCFACWKGAGEDQFRYDTGNCFRTEEECQAKIDRDRAIASGRAVVVDVPEGWEVDSISDLPSVKAKLVYFQRTPPPPPKEVVVKVYDRNVHGEPNTPRSQWVSETEYIYTDELEGF